MNKAKPVSTPLATHFRLTKAMCPGTLEGESRDVFYSICFYSRIIDVCYDLDKPEYCSCSGSDKQVHGKSGKGTLAGSQMDTKVSKGNQQFCSVLQGHI